MGSRVSLLPQDIKTKPKQSKNRRALGSALSSDSQHKAYCLTSHLGDPHCTVSFGGCSEGTQCPHHWLTVRIKSIVCLCWVRTTALLGSHKQAPIPLIQLAPDLGFSFDLASYHLAAPKSYRSCLEVMCTGLRASGTVTSISMRC